MCPPCARSHGIFFIYFPSAYWIVANQAPENLKKFQANKLVKSYINQNFFITWNCIFGSFKTFSQFKNWFLAIFEIAKNGIWSKENFMKLIYLMSSIFLPGFLKIFWPHTVAKCTHGIFSCIFRVRALEDIGY